MQNNTKSINLIMKPTDACNLRCKHCYAAETGYLHKTMNINIVKKILDVFAKDFDEIRIIWHGGEPLLMGMDFYKEVFRLQDEYPCKKFTNSIQSNATLITEEWVDFFIGNKIKLGISFDGQYNDVLRNKTSEVIKAINLMKSKNFNFGAICVICKKTIDKLIDIYEFFKCIGVPLKINPIFFSGEAKNHSSFILSTNQYVKSYLEFFEYWLNDNYCNIRVDYALNYVAQYLGKKETLCTYTSCLTKWFGVHYNGDIYPCGRAYPEEYKIGNIDDFESSSDMFSSATYQQLLEGAIKRRNICKNKCEFYNKCQGGCNNNAIINGDIAKPNFQECQIFKKLNKPITDILRQKLVGNLDDIPKLNPTVKDIKVKKQKQEI